MLFTALGQNSQSITQSSQRSLVMNLKVALVVLEAKMYLDTKLVDF